MPQRQHLRRSIRTHEILERAEESVATKDRDERHGVMCLGRCTERAAVSSARHVPATELVANELRSDALLEPAGPVMEPPVVEVS